MSKFISDDVKLDFKDVLIMPSRSEITSRAQVDVTRKITFPKSQHTIVCVPIMASNMDTVGTFEIAKILAASKIMCVLHKFYSIEEQLMFLKNNPECIDYVVCSIGINDGYETAVALCMSGDLAFNEDVSKEIRFKHICVDVANGYSSAFISFVKDLRNLLPSTTIIAGNVVSFIPELAMYVDVVKLGIGPGSVCTTRIKSGIGYPQLSVIMDNIFYKNAKNGLQTLIMSDGGCENPGDVAKAFVAGADFVMLGNIFAGHDESPGETVVIDGIPHKEFYGMSSKKAMDVHHGGVAEYRASEGKQVLIKSRGPLSNTILDLLGGLRRASAYCGASNLLELSKAQFIKVNRQVNDAFKG